jgi:hypothetical protein
VVHSGAVTKGRSIAFALVILAAPAGAQESKCTAAKHQAAGEYARALEACRAKAVKRNVALDPACEAKALAAFEKRFAKAERKADCIATSEGGLAAEAAGQFVADLAASLERGEGVCCALTEGCGWVTDPTACAAFMGEPGPEGTVCDGTGCVAAPAAGGPCCEAPGNPLTCVISPDVPYDLCTSGPGTAFVEPAICATGRCIRFEPPIGP